MGNDQSWLIDFGNNLIHGIGLPCSGRSHQIWAFLHPRYYLPNCPIAISTPWRFDILRPRNWLSVMRLIISESSLVVLSYLYNTCSVFTKKGSWVTSFHFLSLIDKRDRKSCNKIFRLVMIDPSILKNHLIANLDCSGKVSIKTFLTADH